MLNEDQYNYVKDILVDRMSKYRRNSFRLDRLYVIIEDKTNSDSYVSFEYSEFRDMFKKECVDGHIPNREFSIVEEGYLDAHERYPYAKVTVKVFPKKSKSLANPNTTVNSRSRCE